MNTKKVKVTQHGRTYWDGTGLVVAIDVFGVTECFSYYDRELFLEVPAEWDVQRIQLEVESREFDVSWNVTSDAPGFDSAVRLGDDEVYVDALDCVVEDDESEGVTRYSLTEGGEDGANTPVLQISSEMVTKAMAESSEVTP